MGTTDEQRYNAGQRRAYEPGGPWVSTVVCSAGDHSRCAGRVNPDHEAFPCACDCHATEVDA